MSKKLKLLTLIPVSMLTVSCAGNTTAAPLPPPPVSEFCLIAKGIGYAQKPAASVEDQRNRFDTEATIKDVEAHNRKYEAVCSR